MNTYNDALSSRQVAHWMLDAEQVLRTAAVGSDEYVAAKTISTLGLAILGISDELCNLRTRNHELESLLAVQQRAIDTQREEINSLKSGEPVGYLVGTALLENMAQAVAYRAGTGLEIKPLFTCAQAAWYPAEISPDVPRGEFLDCWVAGYVCERDHAAGPEQYTSAQLLVLLARWGGAELLRGGSGGWSFDERLPDGGLKILAWQPIVKPDYPLGAL
ncbi:hypothetical protein FNI18_06095 [Salmonella enterica subsp. salamae]|nr:hypothetical protein [Salmonella enterica subsp. salamae]